MTFHDGVAEGGFLDVGCVFLDLVFFVEGGGEDCAEEDVYFVVGFEGGGHLLVDYYFGHLGGCCGWVGG